MLEMRIQTIVVVPIMHRHVENLMLIENTWSAVIELFYKKLKTAI